ncbi:MAG TPA: glycosyltransferase [Candidatus Elarobacter sp.]|jgi:glycosyltransferase involved in cell wall biosynthesis|nr:glycosyltransferase [Candidatus Elarobacter sp.]
MTDALVSVIVPTRNSAPYLERALASVRAQRYAPIELIVADNHSQDGTVEIARRLADTVISIGPERSAQCNAAVRASRGKYVYRIDSDNVPDPEVVAAAVAACEAGADAVQVHNDSDPSIGYWAKVHNFERRMYRYDTVHVAARFWRRSAFDAVGGFDESLVAGEDYDLHNRLLRAGFRIAMIAPSEINIGEAASLREIAEKAFYYGRTVRPFFERNGARGIVQINPVRGAYLRHWRNFVAEPGLSAGFVLMQTVKYAAGAAGLAYELMRPSRRAL